MQRASKFLITTLIVLGATGCAEWSDPANFDAEREALQDEWEGACGDPCSGDGAPAACGIVGDAESCDGYNQANARACIDMYERVIRRDVCSATHEDMINLGKICNAVYVNCGGDTDTGGTDGETDTSGETDSGGTE